MNKQDRYLVTGTSFWVLVAAIVTLGAVYSGSMYLRNRSPTVMSFSDYINRGCDSRWLELKGVYLDFDHAIVSRTPIQVQVPALTGPDGADPVKLVVDVTDNYREQALTGLLPKPFYSDVKGILRPDSLVDLPNPATLGLPWRLAPNPQVLILGAAPSRKLFLGSSAVAVFMWIYLVVVIIDARRRAQRSIQDLPPLQ